MFYDYKPYVSAAERKRRAKQALDRFRKKDPACAPVSVAGRAIATTFWGKSWCDNIERYSDFYNRLERGRTYVRRGAVIDLQIAAGSVKARVMGSSLYTVEVKISAVPHARWSTVCKSCSGEIDSLVELLQGRFSKGVMEHICAKETGLFPSPKEIRFTCSCPDWADMCKHIAAVLYGIGARLDERPQLLFALRKVDEKELIAAAGSDLPLGSDRPGTGRRLDSGDLSEMFGIEIAAVPAKATKTAHATPKRDVAKPRARKKKIAARNTARVSASAARSADAAIEHIKKRGRQPAAGKSRGSR
ncbi:MAG: SWIM zinc finger family protein [Burkholderiales bacterium]